MMVNVRQRDGDGRTTGITGSSDVRGDKEETDVPFDPEATGVIPKLTFDQEPSATEGSEGAAEEPATDADDRAADQTMTFRIPGPLHIGRPPTVEEAADPGAGGTVAMPAQQPGGSSSEPGEPGGSGASSEPSKPSKPSKSPETSKAEGKAGDGAKTSGGPQKAGDGAKTSGGPQKAATAGSEAVAATAGSEAVTPGPRKAGAPAGESTPETEAPVKGRAADAASKDGGTAPAKPDEAQPPATPDNAPTKPGLRTQQPGRPQPPSGPQPTSGPQPAGGGRPQQAAAQAGTGAKPSAGAQPRALVGPVTAPAKGGQPGPGGAPQALQQQTGPRQTPAAAKPRTGGGRIGALIASAPKWLPALMVVEGLVMYILALKVPPGPFRGVDPNNIDGLGLISALPATAFIAIIIMIVSFFVTVAQSTDRKFLLLFQIAAITFALHGAGALVAEEPRFPTAYIHAGFVDFISRTGETAISIDARMGWPGFFALFAFVTKAAGITDMTPILQWTPLVSNLLYLLPFVLILRQVVATTRARWFAALLFVLVQWIGQDYFSPQGFTFALYLAFVAILLRWFGRVEQRTKPIPPKGLRKLLGKLDAMTPGELANTGTYRADKLLMLLMLLALFFASVASHQITPFMMLGVVAAFLLFKRTSLTWALPFFLGLVVLAWISYMTVGFWSSQIDAIFGGLGNILQNLRSNTGDRIEGSDPAHAMVLQARLGILAVILSLAATGLFRRLRRGVFDRSALILLCVPVLALGLQSYGGEIGLRIYMFALPGSCLLAAYAFFPNLPADSADVREETVPMRKRNVRFNPQLTKRISVVLAACFSVLFAFAFLMARYGNEKFERVTYGEVAAMHYVYAHDKPSARVVYLTPKLGNEVTPTMPWGEKDVEIVSFNQQALVHKDPTKIADAVNKLKEQPRNSYLMVSRGQVSYLQLNDGYPADWGEKFRAALDASPDLKRVYANKDAALYTWKKFVRGTEIPDPRPYAGRGDPTSPWTPVGVGALVVTWISLFGYEVIRLNGPNRARRTRRTLIYLAIPSFVVAFAVIVERFIYIAQNN
jgi:hypothetical protein